MVVISWVDSEGKRHQWAHALKLKDEKIMDMQDYATPAKAVAATRLRAAFS